MSRKHGSLAKLLEELNIAYTSMHEDAKHRAARVVLARLDTLQLRQLVALDEYAKRAYNGACARACAIAGARLVVMLGDACPPKVLVHATALPNERNAFRRFFTWPPEPPVPEVVVAAPLEAHIASIKQPANGALAFDVWGPEARKWLLDAERHGRSTDCAIAPLGVKKGRPMVLVGSSA